MDPQNKKIYDSEEGILGFDFLEFLKSLFYHVLFLMVLGPFANLIIGPIEGFKFLRNAKFFETDFNFVV